MNKGIGKIVGIVLAVMVGIYIFTLLAPLGVVLGAIGIWYFTKKTPDKGKKNASIALLALSIIFVVFGGSDEEVATETAVGGEKTVATTTAESTSEEEEEPQTSAEKKAEADAKAEKEAQELAEKEAEEKAKADAKAEEEAQKLAAEQALADAKANGNSTEALQPILSTDSTIQSIELIEGTMKVVYKDETTWSDNSLLTTFPSQPVDLMEIMKDNPNIGGYVFERLATMTDAKGNSSVYPVIVVYFSQANAQSINYEEYNIRRYDNFYRVADALRIDMNIFRDTDLQKDGIAPNRGVDNNTFIDSANNYGQY